MELSEALQIVLDLAMANMADKDERPSEHTRQAEAIDLVERHLDEQE